MATMPAPLALDVPARSYTYRAADGEAGGTSRRGPTRKAASAWHTNAVTAETLRKLRRAYFLKDRAERAQETKENVLRFTNYNTFFQQLTPSACAYLCSVAVLRVLNENEVLGRTAPDVLYIVMDGAVALHEDKTAAKDGEGSDDDGDDVLVAIGAAEASARDGGGVVDVASTERRVDMNDKGSRRGSKDDEDAVDRATGAGAQPEAQPSSAFDFAQDALADLPAYMQPGDRAEVLGTHVASHALGQSFFQPASARSFKPRAIVALQPDTEVLRISLADYNRILRKAINFIPLSENVRSVLRMDGSQRTSEDIRTVADAISRHSFFSSLPASTVHGMAPSVRLVSVPKRGVIFKQGDPGSAFYIIVKGSVSIHYRQATDMKQVVLERLNLPQGEADEARMSTVSHETDEKNVHTLDDMFAISEVFGDCVDLLSIGDGFGERALLSKQIENRSASAIAREDAEILRVEKADFEILTQSTEVSRHVLNPNRLRDMFRKDPEQRTDDEVQMMLSFTRNLKFFKNMASADSAHELLRRAKYLRLMPNRLVVVQGDIGEHFYIILSGRISVHVKDENALMVSGSSVRDGYKAIAGGLASITPPNGDPSKVGDVTSLHGQLIRAMHSGMSFGEIALLSRTVRTATVITQEETEFAVISRDDYNLVIRNDHEREIARKTRALLHLPRMRDWSRVKIMRLCYSLQHTTLERGSEILTEGKVTNHLYFLLDGLVRLSKGRSVLSKHPAVMKDADNAVLSAESSRVLSAEPSFESAQGMMTVAQIRSKEMHRKRAERTAARGLIADGLEVTGDVISHARKNLGTPKTPSTFDVVGDRSGGGGRAGALLASGRAGGSAASGGKGGQTLPKASPVMAVFNGVEVAQVCRGEILGLLSALTREPEAMAAVAITAVECFRCNASEMLRQISPEIQKVWVDTETETTRLRLERLPGALDTFGKSMSALRRRDVDPEPANEQAPLPALPAPQRDSAEDVGVMDARPALEGWYGGDEMRAPPTAGPSGTKRDGAGPLAVHSPIGMLARIADAKGVQVERDTRARREQYRRMEIRPSEDGTQHVYLPADAIASPRRVAGAVSPRVPRRSDALKHDPYAVDAPQKADAAEGPSLGPVADAIAAALKRSSQSTMGGAGSSSPRLPKIDMKRVNQGQASPRLMESPSSTSLGSPKISKWGKAQVLKPVARLGARWRGWATERNHRPALVGQDDLADDDVSKTDLLPSGAHAAAQRKTFEDYKIVETNRGTTLRKYELDSEAIPQRYGVARLVYCVPDENALKASAHYQKRQVTKYERERVRDIIIEVMRHASQMDR